MSTAAALLVAGNVPTATCIRCQSHRARSQPNKNVTPLANPATFVVDDIVVGVVSEDIVRRATDDVVSRASR